MEKKESNGTHSRVRKYLPGDLTLKLRPEKGSREKMMEEGSVFSRRSRTFKGSGMRVQYFLGSGKSLG